MFRREAHWLVEQGPDHDLREFRGGHPTGRVARVAWAGEAEHVRGRDVSLYAEGTRLTLVGRAEPGRGAVRLHLPRRSVVDVSVVPEPGIPRVMVTLTVQLGPARFPVQLWFDAAARPVLERILRGLGWTPLQPAAHRGHEPAAQLAFDRVPPGGHEPAALPGFDRVPRGGQEPAAAQRAFEPVARAVREPEVASAPTVEPSAEPVSEPAGHDAPELALLEVHTAPAGEDWLVFRPGPCSAEVLRTPNSGSPG